MLVKNIDRPLVYNIFEFILDKTNVLNDLVVRVTAGRQMKNVIDPWDMQIETFLPHAELILGRIITLVEEVDLVETKLALLDTISTIVIRMEHHVSFQIPVSPLLRSIGCPFRGWHHLTSATSLGSV